MSEFLNPCGDFKPGTEPRVPPPISNTLPPTLISNPLVEFCVFNLLVCIPDPQNPNQPQSNNLNILNEGEQF